MIEFSIDFDPNPVMLVGAFNTLALDIRSYRVPLERSVQKVLAPSFQLNFEVGGRPGWAPLAPATVEKKARLGYPSATLIEKGVLRRTVGFLSLWNITQESATIPGWPGYAFHGIFHQEGTVSIPARPPLVIQPEDEEGVQMVFEDWLDERLQRFVGRFGF